MPGLLCEHCTGTCCSAIALPIDEPETREDFDDIRWYIIHDGISVFVEDGDWYVSIQTRCHHLEADYRCNIYATRPKVCRDYSTDNCEYHAGDYGFDQHFLTGDQLMEYAAEKLRTKRRAGKATNGAAKKKKRTARARFAGRRARRAASPVLDTSDARGVPLPLLGDWR